MIKLKLKADDKKEQCPQNVHLSYENHRELFRYVRNRAFHKDEGQDGSLQQQR